MSVAFTREDSAETASEAELPDRPIPPHANWVTAKGLELLTQALAAATAGYEAAQAIGDINERRRASAPFSRDLRYFSARVKSAQLKSPPEQHEAVAFGHQVSFEREDGRKQTFRIVGDDEADPAQGTISYASPVARALLGKKVGDLASVNGQEIEITKIEMTEAV
jgi:transcription elongation GreA/GreB family factor